MSNKIHKGQKLKSEKAIELLFREGKSLFIYPIKLQFHIGIAGQFQKQGLAFSVSASKKNFKRAVDRNLLKRRMREAFRQEKKTIEHHLITNHIHLSCMFIFVGKTISDYTEIQKSISIISRRLYALISKEIKTGNLIADRGDEDREMI